MSIKKAAEKKKLTYDIALHYQEKLQKEMDHELLQSSQIGGRKNSSNDPSKTKRATKLLNLLYVLIIPVSLLTSSVVPRSSSALK